MESVYDNIHAPHSESVYPISYVRKNHPFETKAYVILPDHLHCLWKLPEGDADFSTRWRLIKHFASQ